MAAYNNCIWQNQGKRTWVFGPAKRGFVRTIIASITFNKHDGYWHYQIDTVNDLIIEKEWDLPEAIKAVEKILFEVSPL